MSTICNCIVFILNHDHIDNFGYTRFIVGAGMRVWMIMIVIMFMFMIRLYVRVWLRVARTQRERAQRFGFCIG